VPIDFSGIFRPRGNTISDGRLTPSPDAGHLLDEKRHASIDGAPERLPFFSGPPRCNSFSGCFTEFSCNSVSSLYVALLKVPCGMNQIPVLGNVVFVQGKTITLPSCCIFQCFEPEGR
jgi:hypothetical protein